MISVKELSFKFALSALLLCLGLGAEDVQTSTKVAEQKKVPYIQVSSVVSQFPTMANRTVNFEQVDGSSQIDFAENKNIVIKQTGTYFILAVGQIGAEKTGDMGYVDLWFERNGKEIPSSGSRQSIASDKLTAVVISQSVIELNAGDTLSVGFGTNKSGLGLVAFKRVQQELSIPSIVLTINKLDY